MKKTAKEFREILTKASDAYYNQEAPIMSDDEFDKIYDEFKSEYPDDVFFKTVGSKTNSVFPKEKHQIPMGSQSKINTEEEFEDWSKKIKKQTKEVEYVISDKIDGLSLSLVYEKGVLVKAITRGDGIEGENILSNALKIKGVNKELKNKISCILRGEIVLHKKDFEEHFKDKANPRNAAAGTIRRLDGERCEYLTFYAYDLNLKFDSEYAKFKEIADLKFLTPNYKLLKEEEVVNYWKNYENKIRDSLAYEIDGLIVCVNNTVAQDQLGVIDQRPRFARAFKFQPQRVSTKVVNVNWQTGKSGRVTPVAQVDPVKVGGVTVTNLSVHNLSELKRINLKMDSKVIIKRAGDVIPQIEEVLDGKQEIEIPKDCPVCGKKLKQEEIFLVCINKNCDAIREGALSTWVETLEIKGLGEEIVKKLYQSKLVRNPVDFYKLTLKDLSNLERMGEKSAKKIIDQLKEKNKLTLPKFVKGLGIPFLSERTMELVIPHFSSLDKILKLNPEDLIPIQGIGEKNAKVIIEGINSIDWINEILKYITIVEPPKVGTKLKGQNFCFTGFRDKNLEQEIVLKGGKIVSSVSSNLTYLVVADKEDSSSKIKKAKELNIPLFSVLELKEYLK